MQRLFIISIPDDHSRPERAVLSIKAQIYDNYKCLILGNISAYNRLVKKFSLNKDRFLFQEADPDLPRSTDACLLELKRNQCFAHSFVLAQLNHCFHFSGTVGNLELKFSDASTASCHSLNYEGESGSENFYFSSDLFLVTESGLTDTCPSSPGKGGFTEKSPKQDDSDKASCAISTIITPDYLPSALLSLGSYIRNCDIPCDPYIFLATEDDSIVRQASGALGHTFFNIWSPVHHSCQNALRMGKRYQVGSNEYRWGMKSVVMAKLLEQGYESVLHLDPDIYAVDNITDLQRAIAKHEISVFPHFRNPDNEEERRFLYQDGFFNGGMLGASGKGFNHLHRLTQRCLREIRRDRSRNLFDDQKYYDNFIFEVDKLFINKDKGIDYSIWNRERTEGLAAPSQRSFLLHSGHFVRIWHMHSDFIKSLLVNHSTLPEARPVLLIYNLARLYIFLFLAILDMDILNVISRRLKILLTELAALFREHDSGACDELIADILSRNMSREFLISKLADLSLSSPSFDNFALFADFLEWLMPDSAQSRTLCEKFLECDFRYITDNHEPAPGINEVCNIQIARSNMINRIINSH